MAADAELGVMLEPTNDLEEDVDDISVGVTGDGGGSTPAQREQQEGIVAGGVSKGLAAAGVLSAILSQLKSVSGIVNSIFSVASRALLPAIEVISDILRPINEAISSFLNNPVDTGKDVLSATGIRPREDSELIGSDRFQTKEEAIQDLQNQNQQGGENVAITQVSPSDSADQTGEGFLATLNDFLQDPLNDKTGGGTF